MKTRKKVLITLVVAIGVAVLLYFLLEAMGMPKRGQLGIACMYALAWVPVATWALKKESMNI